jgi:hypothetical protein
MTVWMLWATVVGMLLALSAHVADSTLRAVRRPARWAWVAAILGAVTMQAWSVLPWSRPSPGSTGGSVAIVELSAVFELLNEEGAGAAAGTFLRGLDTYVLVAWISASTVLMLGLVGGLLRLHQRARGWRRGTVDGTEVLVSDDFGPALLGIHAPRVILPERVMTMDPHVLRVVCAHEVEHRTARDAWLLAGGALLVTLMPWNAALWWKVRRLREAIEIDCDERVLRRGVSKREYGTVLLDLATGPMHPAGVMPAFAQPVSLLERRLTMMISGVRRKGVLATAASATCAVLLGIAACETAAPTQPTAEIRPPVARVIEVLPGDQPLVYIDGVRVEESPRDMLRDINADDIESIEVIKGAAAMQYYGPEAADGVIHIVLK